PGTGHSSPVLWGDKIFLTSSEEKAGGLIVLCLGAADGGVLWRKDFPFAPYRQHQYSGFATTSPAVDADRVYVAWAMPRRLSLLALTHDGQTVWDRDLGPIQSQHGGGSSPIVHAGKVILANHQDADSFLIAVDAGTGETRWKTPRRTTRADYSTPCLYEVPGQKPTLIFNSLAHGISALDPDNGQVLWEYDKALDKRSVSSPVVASGLIIGSCGSGGGGNFLVAVRPGNPAAGKKPELAYEIRRSAPYVPTSVAAGPLLFLWSDNGIVTCLHAPSGEVRWQERVGGTFFGSPVCVDGRLFCISTSGEVVVVEAADQFRLLARNPLGDLARTTPAVAGGRMYLRTAGHLFSVGGKQVQAAVKGGLDFADPQ
ncbi:MAG: PQQ-binding-like beta-propeller repeat protein, partial [Chloroflexi bacterium]|nr:PQQ-binding-like beta-propeller repeat protein [Chloroflexota bacterium]